MLGQRTHKWRRNMSSPALSPTVDSDQDPSRAESYNDSEESNEWPESPESESTTSNTSEISNQSAPATLSAARNVLYSTEDVSLQANSLGQPYSLPESHAWNAISRTSWKNMLHRQPISTLRNATWFGDRASRPLLLTFDAFDTLFTPAEPIAKQYCDVAREWGFEFNEADVMKSFKDAFKNMNQRFPNYGKDSHMEPSTWWSRLIHNTLAPLLPAESKQDLPRDLSTTLYNRFSTSEGYTLFPDVLPFLSLLGSSSFSAGIWPPTRTMLGIISNSDPRVASILSSFGLSIAPSLFPPRYSPHSRLIRRAPDFGPAHFAFATYSYDAGFSKPDRRIFDQAARDAQAALDAIHPVGRLSRTGNSILGDMRRTFHHMHVGDDVEKDVLPALECGWDAVLVDRKQPEAVATREVQGRTVTVVNGLMALREVVTKERLEGQKPVWIDLEGRGPVVGKRGRSQNKKKGSLAGRRLVQHPIGEALTMLK